MMAKELARVLSKLGLCSRTEAARWILAQRVRVNGRIVIDPTAATDIHRDRITIDDCNASSVDLVYLALNKPRGFVTTARDERGRHTVYECFGDARLPYLHPVGRLDQASEGLLLFTNDTKWSSKITEPSRHVEKVYHVQVNCVPDDRFIQAMRVGVSEAGEFLQAKRVELLRHGAKNAWLEIVLIEGRNRHIRRMVTALGVQVMRLIRIRIGSLELGALSKGEWRYLTEKEVDALKE